MTTEERINYITTYPPLSRMWRSIRMAHTNFPARTHSDSVSTALLSLQIILTWITSRFLEEHFPYNHKVHRSSKKFHGKTLHVSKSMQLKKWNNFFSKISQVLLIAKTCSSTSEITYFLNCRIASDQKANRLQEITSFCHKRLLNS